MVQSIFYELKIGEYKKHNFLPKDKTSPRNDFLFSHTITIIQQLGI